MILIALGGNLISPQYGPPRATLAAALDDLRRRGVAVVRVSRFYETAPVPASDQPWFTNAVAEVETDLSPEALLAILHQVEAAFGRVRAARNEARILDLDLIACGDVVLPDAASWPGAGKGPLVLPHPRMHQRRFVLSPLCDLAPDWPHPVLGRTASELLANLPAMAPDGNMRLLD